jgi:regulator of cell morphogenesis and NO signaling
MPGKESELDCQWTVGQVIERYPATATVFNRYGIDLCCGSSVSVREAAHRDGIDPDTLCAELRVEALTSIEA